MVETYLTSILWVSERIWKYQKCTLQITQYWCKFCKVFKSFLTLDSFKQFLLSIIIFYIQNKITALSKKKFPKIYSQYLRRFFLNKRITINNLLFPIYKNGLKRCKICTVIVLSTEHIWQLRVLSENQSMLIPYLILHSGKVTYKTHLQPFLLLIATNVRQGSNKKIWGMINCFSIVMSLYLWLTNNSNLLNLRFLITLHFKNNLRVVTPGLGGGGFN